MTGRVQINNLSRSFGALKAVSDVTFAAESGEFRAIIGPNGAGKTTLFHLLSGIIAPTAGEILIDNQNITRLPSQKRCRLGISRTFQISSVFSELSVMENVRIAAQLKNGGSYRLFGGRKILDDTTEAARVALTLLGLEGSSDLKASALSHGDIRLTEIAMALVQNPTVLLLDEPTQGLSAEETEATVKLLQRISDQRKITILLVEHDMDVVFELADRISVLHFGRLIADGPPADIRADAEVRRAYLGDAP